MPDETLTPSKKNEAFILITRNNLSPTAFEWEERKYRTATITGRIGPSNTCSVLKYNDRYYFAFYFASINYDPEFAPGLKKSIERETGKIWTQVLDLFEKWLHKLKSEVLEPDLWEELRRFRPPAEIESFEEQAESYFNYDEVEKLKKIFDNIKNELIVDYRPDQLTQDRIIGRTKLLVDFAKCQKVGYWREYCIGSLIMMSMELGLGPEQTGGYWQTIAGGFAETRHFLETGRKIKIQGRY